MTQIIAMWSGPRNLSTAMMRSFGARADCAVLDEPYFAPYLARTGKQHPGREETLEEHEADPDKVAEICAGAAPHNAAFYFQKHMPHHMLADFSMDWAKTAKHFFLIREPARVIASYAKGRGVFDMDDLGFAPQRLMFERLTALTGKAPPVIDSVDILNAPTAMLRSLCTALEIPFDPAMLSWPAGARAEDGAWAPYWYGSVEKSTGFGKAPSHDPVVPPKYQQMLSRCEQDYSALRAVRLRV